MSRIGIQPIPITDGATVTILGQKAIVKGPKGEHTLAIPSRITVAQEANCIHVTRKGDSATERALHGLTRSLLANAVKGVTDGFVKSLEIKGVGYRAKLEGQNLVLAVGFSHPVIVAKPIDASFQVKGAKIDVLGIDKQRVGEIAAMIRRIRPPDAYKGKGIRYEGEVVRLKPGKAVKAAGGAA